MPYILVSVSSILVAFVQVFLKLSSRRAEGMRTVLVSPWFLAAVGIQAVATALTIVAYREGRISRLYPLYASSIIWGIIAGKAVFKEHITSARVAGSVLVLFGVVMCQLL